MVISSRWRGSIISTSRMPNIPAMSARWMRLRGRRSCIRPRKKAIVANLPQQNQARLAISASLASPSLRERRQQTLQEFLTKAKGDIGRMMVIRLVRLISSKILAMLLSCHMAGIFTTFLRATCHQQNWLRLRATGIAGRPADG